LSLRGQEETLSDELDSENLADLVGTKMAYDAFEHTVSEYRDQNLAGLNMTVQQLFFVNHCAKECSEDNTAVPPYASPRARCIVPLMNMREFSSAFGCAARTPMNPREKCTFWWGSILIPGCGFQRCQFLTFCRYHQRLCQIRRMQVVPVPLNPGENPRVCSTPICRIAAQWLRARINPSVDPCQDFYGYVCSKFRGQDETVEAHYLVEWMTIWGLDLHRLDDMENMNPVDTIVRFSLDLGVQAVIVFRADDKYFVKGKRVLWAIPGQLRWSSTAYVKGLQNSSQTKVVALSPSHVRAKIIQRLRDFTLPLLRLRGHRYAAIKERKVGFTAFWQRRWQTARKLIVYLCLTGDTRAAAVVEHDIGQGTAELKPS
ncbi:hypothetical protein MRX96_041263, partial [Rhipicephalus microplus]